MNKRTEYRLSEGDFFHIYNRGVLRRQIFDSRDNYSFFTSRMEDAWAASELTIVCFCLMSNHFHFLLRQLLPDGIANFMKSLGNSYAKALNEQRGTTGHVLESKYKIKLVNSDEYLIWLSRYIHRNPVDAKLVRSCAEWEYSSYRDFVQTRRFRFISPDAILSHFPSQEHYRRYVEEDFGKMPPGAEKYLIDE